MLRRTPTPAAHSITRLDGSSGETFFVAHEAGTSKLPNLRISGTCSAGGGSLSEPSKEVT
jgi:hypothetical protein